MAANQFDIIKQKTAAIFGRQIADKAGAMAQQMMADMIESEVGEIVGYQNEKAESKLNELDSE